MYNQLDFLRDKQIMEAKAKISKIPTKISILSVVFFVPLILILVLAPVIIEYFNNL
jgi:pilus assembly protein TadC